MYNFSDPDNSDDEDGLTDGFYFGKADKEKVEYVLEFSTETEKIHNFMKKSVTQNKTNPNDFEILELGPNYKVNKTWLKKYVQELAEIHALTKNKALLNATLSNADLITKLAALNLKPERPQPSANQQRQMKQIKEAMMCKLEAKVISEFTSSKHPYWFNLVLIENCNDYNLNKYNSLACVVARIFEKFVQSLSKETMNSYLNEEIKLAAFIIGSKYHLLFIDIFAKVYKLNEENQFILPYVKNRVSPDCGLNFKLDFKDKALLINACMMHDHFEFEEILMPLLLQDKLNVLEKYLSNSKAQQQLFVQFLDKRFADGNNLAGCLYRYTHVKDIRSDNLTNKYLGKLLTRLIKQYEIDASHCPNINNQRFFKNLRYLIYRRYVDHSIEYEPWKDLVIECLNQADYLTEVFFEMLADHQEFQEIKKWIKILNANVSTLSNYIQSKLSKYLDEDEEEEDLTENSLDLEVSNKYYRLKLEGNGIKFIDNKELLFESLEELLKCSRKSDSGHIFVGIDTEWKPSLLSGVAGEDDKRASLIQISTQEHVYLIDSSKLYSLLDKNDKQLFSKQFIQNKNIIKVGYGFSEDIKKISHSFDFTNHDEFRQSVLDLEYMVGQLMLLNVSLFETDQDEDTDTKERGLSELVRLCFGKPLNKSEQISNWEKRPLRKTQLTYAALDAYVLLEVFEYLKARLTQLKIKFDIHKCIGKRHKMTSSQQDKDKDKKNSQIQEQQQLNEIKKFEDESFTLNASSVRVQDLKIVCDNMLGGLGKELRRCGVDTIILENDRKHIDVAKIARHENRYAISSGLPYFLIKSQLPEGRCIHVKTQSARSQCAQVLRVLNVSVKISDLFSRCRACNTGSYTIISKKQAKFLWLKYKLENPELFTDYEDNNRIPCIKRLQINRSQAVIDEDYEVSKDKELSEKIDICTFHLVKCPGVRVQFESIFDTTLEVVDTYYICDGCGHIYWEGPHWQNITSRFSHVLTENEIKKHNKHDQ